MRFFHIHYTKVRHRKLAHRVRCELINPLRKHSQNSTKWSLQAVRMILSIQSWDREGGEFLLRKEQRDYHGWFKVYFRMSVAQFDALLAILEPHIKKDFVLQDEVDEFDNRHSGFCLKNEPDPIFFFMTDESFGDRKRDWQSEVIFIFQRAKTSYSVCNGLNFNIVQSNPDSPDVPETNFLIKVSAHHTLLRTDDVITARTSKHRLHAWERVLSVLLGSYYKTFKRNQQLSWTWEQIQRNYSINYNIYIFKTSYFHILVL